jgi:hypothetical protein
MQNLTDGAKNIMRLLGESGHRPGQYLAASRLFYIFQDPEAKRRSVEELIAQGLVTTAPNGSVGITSAGQDWNDEDLSTK